MASRVSSRLESLLVENARDRSVKTEVFWSYLVRFTVFIITLALLADYSLLEL